MEEQQAREQVLGHVDVYGDTVNTASRLEALTKEHAAQLVLSQRVAELAGLDLSAWPAAEHAIRGRSDPLAIRIVASAQDLPAVGVSAGQRGRGVRVTARTAGP